MSVLQIFAGQSNMIVFGLTPALLPAYALTPDPRIQILVGDHFETMVAGVNTGALNTPQAWGPIVSEAHDWTASHPGEIDYVVLSAKGQTSLAMGVAPNWSPEQPPSADGSPNGMFNKTTVLVNEAKALTGLPVSTVFWMQGEQDATDPANAAAYQGRQADVFAHMRAEWGASQIVFGEISDRSGFAYGDEVRAAQQAVAATDPHTVLVNIDDLPLQDDSLHLTAGSALDLGYAFFAGDALGQLLAQVGARFMGEIVAGAL